MSTKLSTVLNKSTNNININTNKTNINNINIKQSVTDVRSKAQRITDKLNNPNSFLYYCKVAWHLPEHQIERYLEQSLNSHNPIKYFSWLTTKSMRGEI